MLRDDSVAEAELAEVAGRCRSADTRAAPRRGSDPRIGIFQDTLDQMVILALFLPVLAGQSGNTGCQALAVTLRGMTLGEIKEGSGRALVVKEALLGCLNGLTTATDVASMGMFLRLATLLLPSHRRVAPPVVTALPGVDCPTFR